MKIKTGPSRKTSFPSLRKEDRVHVLSGKDKGKEGRILKVDRSNQRIIFEEINKIKKSVKPNQTNPQGGFIERENFLNVSKVMLVCPSCHKPTRVGHSVVSDGRKVRVCRQCDEHIDK